MTDPVLGVMRASRVIPVVTLAEPAATRPLVSALLEGGLRAIEITLRTPAGLEAIRIAAAGGDVLVGAGTVTTATHAEAAIEAGARFLVAPGLVEEVIAVAARHDVLMLPGIATPTELLRALALGCRTVKFFPASVAGGRPMVRALAGLATGAGFVPTGGIDIASAPLYLAIPEVVAVGGSWMVPSDRVGARDWDAIRVLATACAGLRSTEG
ncbi:MAG TPA: bifunctional 4-hydroxy-2-oxoglutarate aldolase/2-dehydro-3-deoxy-phosphogluconate aldolase [Candidatus Limnocylindrales bacterium]